MRLRSLILAAAAAAWAGAATAQTTCIMDLNITDQDPAGLNVRASPGGPIIAAVKARKRWVSVDVTGQNGAWARIDSATIEGDEANEDLAGTVLWKGDGWVAFSKLGVGYFYGGTRFRAAPDEHAKVVLSLEGYRDSATPKPEAILGCDGGWLQVRVKGVVGWTDQWCDDEGAVTCASKTAAIQRLWRGET